MPTVAVRPKIPVPSPLPSITRQLSAAHTLLRIKYPGRRWYKFGGGYPNPEASDAVTYMKHAHAHLAALRDGHISAAVAKATLPLFEWQAGSEELEALKKNARASAKADFWRNLHAYQDTRGIARSRYAFNHTILRGDLGITHINPDKHIVPTIGNTGGIHVACAIYEQVDWQGLGYRGIAHFTDDRTYGGFLARALRHPYTRIYSVGLGPEGPDPQELADQIRQAASDGFLPGMYYALPIGHNPGGMSYSDEVKRGILEVTAGYQGLPPIVVLEDHAYLHILLDDPKVRPAPLLAMPNAGNVVMLFTASKIGVPGPRIGFMTAPGEIELADGTPELFSDLALKVMADDNLFLDPLTAEGFAGYLTRDGQLLDSLWPIAEATRIPVYKGNRDVTLRVFDERLGKYPEHFRWTRPGAGFMIGLNILTDGIFTDAPFMTGLMEEDSVIATAMRGFVPPDALVRDPMAAMKSMRLAFSASDNIGEARLREREEDAEALARALLKRSGLPIP